MRLHEARDIVITGLPRSGTSFLCARVNEFQNAVVINEPAEIFGELREGGIEGLGSVFSSYRADIAAGKPVYNKIKDGKFIEDTGLEDSRSLHIHPVEGSDFALGIKNTLVFMAMLTDITGSRKFPKIIASVRHPYDCIGSWNNVSFAHLNQAKPDFLKPYATGPFVDQLTEIIAEQERAVRSAKLWSMLAKTLFLARKRIQVVRYEDMVTKPEQVCQSIGDYLSLSTGDTRKLTASKPVRRREQLDQAQKEAIKEHCGKIAAQFGYRVN